MKKLTMTVLMLVATSLPASAQLPDAKTLISKYASAVGGDAMMKLKSIKETGSFEMAAAGVNGTIEVTRANPNKSIVHINIPGIGDAIQGFDGTVGFSVNPMAGNTVLSGKDLETAAEEAQIGAALLQPEYFTSQETVEKTTMGGRECYKVKLVWKSGRTTFDCFATETGLIVGSVQNRNTPQGEFEVQTTLADYKQFGGITLPTTITQSVMGQEQVIKITNVAFDKVDDAAFALPEAIKALVPKK